MATYSSILAWRIPWTVEPATQSMGSQLVRHDRRDLAHMHAFRDKQEPFIRGIPLIEKNCLACAPYQWQQNLERNLQLSPSQPSFSPDNKVAHNIGPCFWALYLKTHLCFPSSLLYVLVSPCFSEKLGSEILPGNL